MSRLAVLLLLCAPASASAAVVEVKAPAYSQPALAAPQLSLSAPSLTPPSFLAPALLPASLSAPAAELKPILAVPALAAKPLSAPSEGASGRGPPTAKDKGFAAHVAKSAARLASEWEVPVEAILSDHDALLLGENHSNVTGVETLAREMPRLAAAGVTAIGIEGLKAPNQKAVDDYVSGRASVLPAEVLSFSPKRLASFRSLFEAARENGVRVVALGLPLDGWAKQAADLAAQNTGSPAIAFPDDVDGHFLRARSRYEPGYNEAVAEVFLTRRNKVMASFLKDALKAGGKAVVLVGQAHVDGLDMVPGRLMNAPGDWGTLPRELARLALKAFSLTMTGGVYTSVQAYHDDRLTRPNSYSAASAASPDGGQAYEELGPGRALWHAGGTVAKPVAH